MVIDIAPVARIEAFVGLPGHPIGGGWDRFMPFEGGGGFVQFLSEWQSIYDPFAVNRGVLRIDVDGVAGHALKKGAMRSARNAIKSPRQMSLL